MKKKGFTLIELTIVISIISMLSAIALPRFSNVSSQGKVANVQGNLANLKTSIGMYYSKHQRYPDLLNDFNDFSEFYNRGDLPSTPSFKGGSQNNLLHSKRDDSGGWIYDIDSGDIFANLPNGIYTGNEAIEVWNEDLKDKDSTEDLDESSTSGGSTEGGGKESENSKPSPPIVIPPKKEPFVLDDSVTKDFEGPTMTSDTMKLYSGDMGSWMVGRPKGFRTPGNKFSVIAYKSGKNGIVAKNGDSFIKLGGSWGAKTPLYQDIAVKGGVKLNYSLNHRGVNRGHDKTDVKVSYTKNGNSYTKVIKSMSDNNSGWGSYRGSYVVPNGVDNIRLTIVPTDISNVWSGGNLVDNFKIDVAKY